MIEKPKRYHDRIVIDTTDNGYVVTSKHELNERVAWGLRDEEPKYAITGQLVAKSIDEVVKGIIEILEKVERTEHEFHIEWKKL